MTSNIFFCLITGLEFAYTQAHPSMQGLVTGLYLAAVGLGNYLSMAITNIVVAATQSGMFISILYRCYGSNQVSRGTDVMAVNRV